MTEHPKHATPSPAVPVAASTLDLIRAQVLRAIALNREPGYHFAGNFLDLSYDYVGTDHTALSVDVQPFSSTSDGQLSLSGFAILADLAMAGAVRAGLDPKTRLATVTMNLQFTGARADGRLNGRGGIEACMQGGWGAGAVVAGQLARRDLGPPRTADGATVRDAHAEHLFQLRAGDSPGAQ